MPWNSTWPLGSASVKANRTTGQQNITYIEVTMGNSIIGTNTTSTRDHFWNVGANEDGRHRFIQSPGFTSGGNPSDPLLGTGMDGVQYLKSDGLTPATIVGFYRNASTIYQHIPAFMSGTVNMPANSSYVTLVNVPANSYGEIFMYTTINGKRSAVSGYFRASATICDSFALYQSEQGASTSLPLKFGNGSDASLLTIQVRNEDASSGQTWNYRITYRAL